MAGSRRRTPRGRAPQTERRIHYIEYTEGSAVRKETRTNEYVRIDVEQERKKYHVRKNWEKAGLMTLPYVFTLTVASVLLVVVSIHYLKARNQINDSARMIRMMESSLEGLREANSDLKKKINQYTDLEYIYKTATEEMGMVQAKENQVVYFDRTESGYVRQNEDIPKE